MIIHCNYDPDDYLIFQNPVKSEEAEKRKSSESNMGISRKPRMSRTVSMCETGMGQTSKLRGPTCSWPRGILKHRTRSLSESQVGSVSTISPLGSVSSSLNLEVPEDKQKEQEEEEGEESVEESMSSGLGEKKSVRFNEVVSRQLFRSNSSILGQRAKNQKKAMKKRKCQQRRASESDPESNLEHFSDDLISSAVSLSTDEDTDGATATDTTEAEEVDEVIRAIVDLDIENNNINDSNVNISSGSENQGTASQNEKENLSHKRKSKKKNKNIISNHSINNSNNDNFDSRSISNDHNNDNNYDSSSSTNNSGNDNEEVNDNDGFIVKVNKRKRKSKKNKNITFEPSNNFIFQLDIDN